MSETCPSPQTARDPLRGCPADPREVLDGVKRARILALLAMSCSRHMASAAGGAVAAADGRTGAQVGGSGWPERIVPHRRAQRCSSRSPDQRPRGAAGRPPGKRPAPRVVS